MRTLLLIGAALGLMVGCKHSSGPSSRPVRAAARAAPSVSVAPPPPGVPEASKAAPKPEEDTGPPSTDALSLWAADTGPIGGSIAIDRAEVYWSVMRVATDPQTGSGRMAGGAIVAKHKQSGEVRTVWSGDIFPWELVLVGTTLVFSKSISGAPLGLVLTVPTSGGEARTLASGLDGPESITTDGSTAFYVDKYRELHSVPLSGGAPSLLGVGTRSRSALAVDDANLYWVEAQSEIWTLPKTGGTPSLVARGSNIDALREDAGYLYFADLDKRTLARVAVTGGPIVELARSALMPEHFGLDATHVYWASEARGEASFFRVSKDGGKPELMARDELVPGRFALDGRHLYFTRFGTTVGIARVGKAHRP